jgi:hypothetical protein
MLLFISFASLGLAACGGSSHPSSSAAAAATTPAAANTTTTTTAPPTTTSRTTPTTPTNATASPQEAQHARLVTFVSCMRQHGVNVPEPNAENHVNARGINPKNPRVKAALKVCFPKFWNSRK